ncbi:hypothetical protein Osc7112_1273 [Oscillatoria nigro-viridis PCC 7112]|uniref:Uncharacterized protein n=1 Tax=Phormidium nigroviride PCC 7112 TaxID=179408 RepID=K9VD04_9CYAN|nr:hypothetical protein Osc7112_1273 [Oscillatoria nigro-viridis PCC 7112]
MRSCWHLNTQECRNRGFYENIASRPLKMVKNPVSLLFMGNIKSVSIGIIPISILDLCVNGRESLVICGPRNYIFFTADEGR